MSTLEEYFRRVLHFGQMDFSKSVFTLVDLYVFPSNVFKNAKNRYIIKNHYYSDDPSFLVLIFYFILVVTFSYGFGFRLSIIEYFKFISFIVFFEFLLSLVFISVSLWLLANKWKFLNKNQVESFQNNDNINKKSVEFLYCVDIQCYAFLTSFLLIHVPQYVFLPLLMSESIFSCIFANLIYVLGGVYYFYITWRGFAELEFLKKTEILLLPITFVALLAIIFTIFNWNLTQIVLLHVYL